MDRSQLIAASGKCQVEQIRCDLFWPYGLLITLCASANAAAVHRSKPPQGHLRPGQRER